MVLRNDLAKEFFQSVTHLNNQDAIKELSYQLDLRYVQAQNRFQRLAKYKVILAEISAISIVIGYKLAAKAVQIIKTELTNDTTDPF